MLRAALQTGLNTVWPARCLGCGVVVDGAPGLCGSCWGQTPFIGGTVCNACGVPLPGEADHDVLCDACLRDRPPWDQGRAALIYCDLARKLVLGFKHGDRTELAGPAAGWLAQAAAPMLTADTLVAPIPLHWRRMLKRRYNQAAILAGALTDRTGHALCQDLLMRTMSTPNLDGLSKAERQERLSGAIAVTPRRRHRMAGRPVLLVDDVHTSGATFAAATEACLEAGASRVCVLALARVAYDT